MSDAGALRVSDPERLRRWRMVLGGADDGTEGSASGVTGVQLDGNDARVDAALAAVYDSKPRARGGGGRSGGLGSSAPSGARWPGATPRYFPTPGGRGRQPEPIDRPVFRQLLRGP